MNKNYPERSEKYSEFELFLMEISAEFINLPYDRIDGKINDGLRQVVEFMEAERCTLLEFRPENSEIYALYSYGVPGVGPDILGRMDLFFPWAVEKMVGGEIVHFSSLEELPGEAETDRQTFIEFGMKSGIIIPVDTGGSLRYVLATGTSKSERIWPKEFFPRLRLLGEVFANAMGRKQADEKLTASEASFASMFENAPISMLLLDRERHIQKMNRQARKVFSLPEVSSKEHQFGDAVRCVHHLDDPDGCRSGDFCRSSCDVRRVIEEAFETGLPLHQVEADLTFGEGERQRESHFLVSAGFIDRPDHRELLVCIEDITVRKRAENKLREALEEVSELKEQFEHENIILREEIELRHRYDDIIGESRVIREVLNRAEQVAGTDSTVLITGETGTGKELVARAIHWLSPRKTRPMVTVNCAALPATLLESELFGREKGAYTGAMTRQKGRFEVADGSTIFLDEISELSTELQAKLLRVLEAGTFERLGSSTTLTTDVRIIAATNRDLEEMVKGGGFREDLLYRVKVFPIHIPPLRERTEDIPLLVWSFITKFSQKMGKKIETISRQDMESLQRYPWPGNIRELRNVIEHALIISPAARLRVELPQAAASQAENSGTLQEMEREHIAKVLERTGWRVKGKAGAAELLDLKPSTLYSRMKKLGITRQP